MGFTVLNVGERSAVLTFNGVIVGTLVCETFYAGETVVYGDQEHHWQPGQSSVVISGLTVADGLKTARHASTPSRGPAARYKREPTFTEMAADLQAQEDYADGVTAVWRLQDGDAIPAEGSVAYLQGVKDALKLRKQQYRGGIKAEEKFTVFKGCARVRPARKGA